MPETPLNERVNPPGAPVIIYLTHAARLTTYSDRRFSHARNYTRQTISRSDLPKVRQACAVCRSRCRGQTRQYRRRVPDRVRSMRPQGHVSIKRSFKTLMDRAKISDVTAHDLRRTAGSLILSSGGSLIQVQRLLRHQSYTTTDRHYGRLAPHALAAASDSICEQLSKMTSGENQ